MYAIIKTGGKQYRVSEGETLQVEKLNAEVGAEVVFEEVLTVVNDADVKIGKPVVEVFNLVRLDLCPQKINLVLTCLFTTLIIRGPPF